VEHMQLCRSWRRPFRRVGFVELDYRKCNRCRPATLVWLTRPSSALCPTPARRPLRGFMRQCPSSSPPPLLLSSYVYAVLSLPWTRFRRVSLDCCASRSRSDIPPWSQQETPADRVYSYLTCAHAINSQGLTAPLPGHLPAADFGRRQHPRALRPSSATHRYVILHRTKT
jgi:hypothetical protein